MITTLIGVTVGVVGIFVVGAFGLWRYIRYSVKRYHAGKPSIWYSSFRPFIATQPVDRQLPDKAGTVYQRSFLSEENSSFSSEGIPRVKILTINIEMGKKLNKIIELLCDIQPDIVLLQEVDICTNRNGTIDSVAEMASALSMDSVFIPQTIFGQGCDGNAVLSKFPIIDASGMYLDCQRKPKHKYKTHYGCSAVVRSPWGLIGCCSIHIDTHCGVNGRIKQYRQLLPQIVEQREKHELKYQIIGGDFNTLCHGATRFLPYCSPDWKSATGTVGYTEAEWFQKHAIEAFNKELGLDFYDPFDKKDDTTVAMARGIYAGKLDWILIPRSTMVSAAHRVGTRKEMVSDHQWVLVEAILQNA